MVYRLHLSHENSIKLYYWNIILAAPISQNPTQSTGIAALIKASNDGAGSSAHNAETSLFGEDGFTFGDLIDIVNPLQHIPIVNTIYRKISGDTIAPAMEIAGGALFGGPFGAAMSIVTTAFQAYNATDTDSTDPDSPYMDKHTDSTSIANNTSQQVPKEISKNDYSLTENLNLNKTNAWVLSSEKIHRAENTHISLNTLQNKPVYQPGDGITNIAAYAMESYTDIISSNKTVSNNIDITIGPSTN